MRRAAQHPPHLRALSHRAAVAVRGDGADPVQEGDGAAVLVLRQGDTGHRWDSGGVRRIADRVSGGSVAGIWETLGKIESLVLESFIVALAALAGLIAISITGALGGAIVYGPDVDPVVSLVYHLLF